MKFKLCPTHGEPYCLTHFHEESGVAMCYLCMDQNNLKVKDMVDVKTEVNL